MSLTPFKSGHSSTPYLPKSDNTGVRLDAGPYVGIVKSNIDPLRMGRVAVLIPTLAETLNPNKGQLITCDYLAPFYGAKTGQYVEKDNSFDYANSQHSYGMWMVPPDIDTRVLVIFAEGRADQAYWIGCIQEPLLNHMIPGIASSTTTGPADSKQSVYGTDNVPAGEINRKNLDGAIKRPIHPQAETLRQQGLVQDTVRGTTSSSARRETPSQVFGISTPGRVDPSPTNAPKKVGAKGSQLEEKLSRLTGHSFVMDDGDVSGKNQLIRFRSATGHQILLNDTAGVVYIANGSGNAWMEFSKDGSIDIYSGNSVAVRSKGNMDFHSDANINLFAKEQIKLAAGQKLVLDGGQTVQTYADYDVMTQSLNGSVTTKAPSGAMISYAGQMQLHMSGGDHHLTGSQVHFNSIPTMPDFPTTYYRTKFYDLSGTGTLNTPTPDVDIKNKYISVPLTVNTAGNITMDGMRVPTHEPFFGHRDKIVSFAGGKPSALSTVPGTPEFVAHLNRTSNNPFVQAAQLQADLKVNLEELGLGSGTSNIAKLQSAATAFTENYSKNFSIPDVGISKIDTDAISSVVNQTIGSITGDVKNLLQNQVFINQGGTLFSASNLNQAISGTVTGAISDLTSVDNFISNNIGSLTGDLTSGITNISGITGNINLGNITGDLTSGITNISGITGNINLGNITGDLTSGITNISGITGNINLGNITGVPNSLSNLSNLTQAPSLGNLTGNIPGIGSLNSITDTYKNVVGSRITSITQVTSLVSNIGSKISSVGRSIGKMFGF
jgi:hypothetical protein